MKYIISGTDRADSNTLKVSKYIQSLYKELGEVVEIIDLKEIRGELALGPHYGSNQPASLQAELDKVVKSDGLIVVCPEYNGSLPGILKYYIDHLKYPDAFEYRAICMVGLGGMFGGMRPVEHLQQIFGYRNAFIYPQRVFLINIFKMLKDGVIVDATTQELLKEQAKGFLAFTKALQNANLDANSHIAKKVPK